MPKAPPRFILLYAALYAAYGVASPFLPAFVAERGLPAAQLGTAQAFYGTVGIGGATALLTVASGALYAEIGAQGFWVMAALCAIALPLTLLLRRSR